MTDGVLSQGSLYESLAKDFPHVNLYTPILKRNLVEPPNLKDLGQNVRKPILVPSFIVYPIDLTSFLFPEDLGTFIFVKGHKIAEVNLDCN